MFVHTYFVAIADERNQLLSQLKSMSIATAAKYEVKGDAAAKLDTSELQRKTPFLHNEMVCVCFLI